MADPPSGSPRPTNEYNNSVLATPAFLGSLRPPPLPLWVQPASALTATSYGLLAVQATNSLGFSIARSSISLGFQTARALSGPLLSVLDYSLGTGGVGPVAQGSALALNAAESVALAGLGLGESITNLALGGASSLNAMLSEVYGGNDEALRTLGVFLQLVRREWTTSLPTDPYQDGGVSRWSLAEVGKAAATWAALQSVTTEVEGRRVVGELEELDLASWGRGTPLKEESEVMWEITEEDLLQGGEEVIAASIGRELDGGCVEDEGRVGSSDQLDTPPSVRDDIVRLHLQRFSRMALGSYGGIGTVFFGVKLPDPPSSRSDSTSTPLTVDALSTLAREKEESSVAAAFASDIPPSSTSITEAALEAELGHMELDEHGVEGAATETTESAIDIGEDYGLHAAPRPSKPFDFWSLISGKHDEAVLHSLAGVEVESTVPDPDSSDDEDDITSPNELEKRRAARHAEQDARRRLEAKGRRPPRFFVITDHPNRSVLLILRGTLGLDDIATDLACEPTPFDSSLYWDRSDASTPSDAENESAPTYQVHGGMMEMALAMGGQDGPVTRAVAKALKRNSGYDLYLIGHSLGAGVASLLGLMWSNLSGLTTSRSGLPERRPVHVYGFATPCVTDPKLSVLCRGFIHTFIYSSDAVSRFSLGHIKDIRSAAAWLCFANNNPEQATTNILSRILAFQRGKLDHDPAAKAEEASWFASLRSALEANQGFSDLFPPGDILWLTRGDDLTLPPDDAPPREGHRLFKVTGRPEVVFKQMLFSRNMLSSHLPHQYMNVIETCL